MSEYKSLAIAVVIIVAAAPILRRWLGIEWGYAIQPASHTDVTDQS